MSRAAILVLRFAASASLWATGCREAKTATVGCQGDEECPTGFVCGDEGGCLCRADESCDPANNEFCNSQGRCQVREGCRKNADCKPPSFCNVASSACISPAGGGCGTDVHCDPGSVCDMTTLRCVPGCFDSGDCQLYSSCERAEGATLGSCTSKCGDRSYCAYGDVCDANGVCQDAPCTPEICQGTDPYLCKSCPSMMAGECGDPVNPCLINQAYDPGNPASGSEFFCGTGDCTGDNSCPNGYSCYDVSILTQDLCAMDSECMGEGRTCEKGEGELRGACTCADDSHCTSIFEVARGPFCDPFLNECEYPVGRGCSSDAQCDPTPLCAEIIPGLPPLCLTDGSSCTTNEDCLCSMGRCLISSRRCTMGAECALRCMNGGCLAGSACAPSPGLLCPITRP